ncbi:MAG TPA: toll/interleukin-1 receptor domain-containing protein, partial [Polyangiaceae bacterium]|nr:toll/interleukin-1 receptor domain-containing protein [Polyangiaceae bacterium]
YFRDAELIGAELMDADLTGADLTGADLVGAELGHIRLTGATLDKADLGSAILMSADLTDAILTDAVLFDAVLSFARLTGANCGAAKLGRTVVADLDLGPLCEALPPVVHEAPTTIDHLSVAKSVRSPRLKEFLVRAGMPDLLADYMIEFARSADGSIFKMMQSTFISHGDPDKAFAKKLYEALHRNGVTTFLFSEHAEPGERLHRMMRRGVNEHDRVVLICSKASLDRKGVMNEIEETLAREARDGGETYLIPIRLDDYVFSGWKPKREDIAQAIRDRVVADFEGADKDDAKFTRELGRLLKALRKPSTVGASGAGGP